jgi:hypothetical protein
MKATTNDKYMYFQFNKKLGLPVYARLHPTDFDPDIVSFLRVMRFDELTEKEGELVVQKLDETPNARLLTINEASLLVARQIASARESDKYGPESIVMKSGYNVYRYKNVAMIVHSVASPEWRMGCFPDFGNVDMEYQYRMVINRFLAWALAPLGIIGFWGTPVDEGVVIQRSFETRGEAVFFDVKERSFISQDGQKKMRYSFQIIKLDSNLANTSIELRFENLLSFLTVNTTYLGSLGLPTLVRQLIQTLCRVAQGQVYPKENFRPRQEAQISQE